MLARGDTNGGMGTRVALRHVAKLEQPARGSAVDGAARPQFPSIYTEHIGFVWRVLQGMGVPASAVADAAQDVFVVVHRRLPEFEARHSITTWLFAIAYRVASNYRRNLKRTRAFEPLDEALRDHSPSPAEYAERIEAQRLALEVLDEIDEEKRLVLVLAEIEQLSAPEISALLELPLNTVYTQLRRARLQFSQALAARSKARPA
jgi:RNA polymerase sigma-70 factor, ECF subfamily